MIRGCLVVKAYYLTYFAALVCLFPYYNVYFAARGFSERQIGVLTSIRPWVSALAGNTLAAVADAWQCHRLVFIAGFALSVILRCALGAVSAFAPAVTLVVLSSIAGEPSGVLADTAAMAMASKVHATVLCTKPIRRLLLVTLTRIATSTTHVTGG